MGDLAPPAAPKEEERRGFFSKWIKKVKENPLSPNAKLPIPSEPAEEYEAPEDVQPLDLEAIRSKLGIEEEKTELSSLEIKDSSIEEGKLQIDAEEEKVGGSEEKTNRSEERTGENSVSPWTIDSPDDLLLTDKSVKPLVGVQKEEGIIVSEEPTKEAQKNYMSLQENPDFIKMDAKESISGEKQLSEVENDELIREVAGPQVNEEVQEKNRASETAFIPTKQISTSIQDLISEHFGAVEEGVKALQGKVEGTRIEPKAIQVENTFVKEAAPDKHFILKNGEHIASLKELLEKLDSMSEEVFKAHVTENKNDFANWIKEALEQERLSEEIRTKKAKEDLLTLLKEEESEVQAQLNKEKAKVEMEHLDLERKQGELEQARERFEALKSELESKGKEWEAFKQRLITDIQANLAEGVSKALVSEQQKLEQEKIRLAGLQNKVEVRLKALERDRQKLDEERKGWEAERMVLEGLKEKESIMAQKVGLLEERERMLRDKEAEVKAMQSALKEALSSSSIHFTEVKGEEKPAKKKQVRKVKVQEKEEEPSVPDDEELRDLEEEITKKMKTSKGKEESVTFDLRKLSVTPSGERRNKGFSSREEIEERAAHCRRLIEAGHLENAKEEYNRIKDLFAGASLEQEDKALIYNSIRELYNDIHLALLA